MTDFEDRGAAKAIGPWPSTKTSNRYRALIDRVQAGTATEQEREAVAELHQAFDWPTRVWEGWEPGFDWLPAAMEAWQATCDPGVREPILARIPEAHRADIAAWMDRLAADLAVTEDPTTEP